jgi:hypothetical protein
VQGLTEASGIAGSGRNLGVLWTHNDGGQPRFFALSTNGLLAATFRIDLELGDVEDIAVGPGPAEGQTYLYLGDIGGNAGGASTRQSVQIIRIPEPVVDLGWTNGPRALSFEGAESFTLVYPDGGHDAEALLVDPVSKDILVATKENGGSRLYRVNLSAATNNAILPLELAQTVLLSDVSAGDISADGTQIVLRSEEVALIWTRCDNEAISAALARPGQLIPIIGPPTEPNGEAIGLLRDATGYVTISEGQGPVLYFFQSLCPAAPKFTLELTNQAGLAGSSIELRSWVTGYPSPSYSWRLNGETIPGQTNATLTIASLSPTHAGQYEVTATNSLGSASSVATLTVRAKPDLRVTEVMSAEAPSPGILNSDWWELTNFEAQRVDLSGWRFNDDTGGLNDAFVLGQGITIQPGESLILVEELTPDQFRIWWGAANLPAQLKVVTYVGQGLSLGANGDRVRLWDSTATLATDTVAEVSFGPATEGISLNYDPVTRQFGAPSRLGVNGVFRAASTPDIGSPGRILAPATPPLLQIESTQASLRLEFSTVAGHRYTLEAQDELNSNGWFATGDSFLAPDSTTGAFELPILAPARFFRVRVE